MKFDELKTPAYVIDEKKLIHNLEILKSVEEHTGCHILLAQKAFSSYALYPLISQYISGTTASGIFEAELGHECMGKENHVFAPAFTDEDMDKLVKICDHVVFNSVNQLICHKEKCINNRVSFGLRVNPEHSTQGDHAIYDPCAPGSRLGVTEENLKKVIAGEKEPPEKNEKVPERKEAKPEKRKFDLVVDIQEKMAQGKNGGYVRWAKKYNVKQFAESILFLQQHDIHDKETLDALVDGSSAKYHELMKTIKDAEEKMAANKVIKTHIINYAKTRETYIAYRKSGYSKKFFEAHRDEITLHKAAKEAFSKLPDGKIPKVKDLNEEFVRLLSEKKAAYSEYKKIKKEMRDYQIAKQNVEFFYAAQQSWDIEEDMRKKRQQER